MNKTQLVETVAQTANLSKTDASRAVDATIESIIKALAQGDSVAIAGFGIFSVKQRAARTGRDPRTGGVLQIPAATVAGFKPAKAVKDAINEKKEGTSSSAVGA